VDAEAFDHPGLGWFEHDIADEVWVAPWSDGARAFDIAVLGSEDDQAPPPAGLLRLEAAVGRLERLMAKGLEAIRAARVARLGWSEGPGDEAWTLLALVSDADGGLWLVAVEPQTDEYSSWWAGFDAKNAVTEVRRGAAGSSYDPHSARVV